MPRNPRFDILFEPVKLGPVTAPNRFYQVPHCTGMGYQLPQSLATMRGIKAEGGWGVVNTEYCSIHPSSDDLPAPFASLWDERRCAQHDGYGGGRARPWRAGRRRIVAWRLPVFQPAIARGWRALTNILPSRLSAIENATTRPWSSATQQPRSPTAISACTDCGVMPMAAICSTERWFSITWVRTWTMASMSDVWKLRIMP